MSSGSPPQGFQPVQSLPEEPSRPPWLIALVVVGIGLVGVLVGALLFAGGPGATPSPTAVAASPSAPASTSRPSASPPSPPATPSPSAPGTPSTGSPGTSPRISPEASPGLTPAQPSPGGPAGTIPPAIAAQIDDVIAQVPPIRDLEQLREVPYTFISREQFQADLEELLAEETDPVRLAAEERALKRLGLLPDDLDLQELLLELYGAGVAAYYQPDNGTFYIIERDRPFGPLDRMYVAHEYDHALQDQHFDLAGTRITDPSEGDAALAQLAVVEGDATWLMVLWAQQNLTLEEVLELLGESLEPADQELLERMPQILVRQLSFPYNEGMIFVSQIQRDAGWTAVNEMFASPPASTEQVLHPEKFEASEEPIAVELPDVAAELGEGWERTYDQTFGELNTQIWVGGGEEPDEPFPGELPEYPFADVAAGWGGDRLHMYEGPDDAWAIVWALAWDSLADAQEFAGRAAELRSTLDGASLILESSEDRSWVLVASDQETLDQLRALGPRPLGPP